MGCRVVAIGQDSQVSKAGFLLSSVIQYCAIAKDSMESVCFELSLTDKQSNGNFK